MGLDGECRFLRISDRGVAVQAAPKIPTGDRAVGMPFFSQLRQFDRIRQGFQAVGFSYRVSYAQVRERHDIRPLQGKHQEHLRRPGPHASDLGKKRNNLVVREIIKFTEIDFPPVNPLSEISQRGGLLPRKAARPQLFRREFQERCGGKLSANRFPHPLKNGVGGLSA